MLRADVDVWCYIVLYIIHVHYYILLYYTILYYTLLFCSFFLSSSQSYLLSPSILPNIPLLYSPLPISFKVYVSGLTYPYLYSSNIPFHHLIHSIRVGTYIYLFILFSSFDLFSPLPSNPLPAFSSSSSSSFKVYVSGLTYGYLCSSFPSQSLTPHKLTEWMVEV